MKFAELINGRAAMFGCALFFLVTITSNTDLIANLGSINLQSIWLALGVYAG